MPLRPESLPLRSSSQLLNCAPVACVRHVSKRHTLVLSLQSNEGLPSQSGVSSLITPYGGLEDFGETSGGGALSSHSSYASKRVMETGFGLKPRLTPEVARDNKSATIDVVRDNGDAMSTSSSEFSGWKNRQDAPKEDSQSVASLELAKKGVKPNLPSSTESTQEVHAHVHSFVLQFELE